ncbi:MAG: hypothetical protein K6A32_09545, partial [Bacteroidales bacterium]|nr:hypothetical protein [Bacteroidales bacterium]
TSISAKTGADGKAVAADVAQRLAVSAVRDTQSGRTYIKIVNLLPFTVQTQLATLGFSMPAKATCKQLAGAWNSSDARPVLHQDVDISQGLTLPAYSFSVIEF